MDETAESNPSQSISLRNKIREVNSDLVPETSATIPIINRQLATSRENAFLEGDQFLTEFPHQKAVAILRALENLSKSPHKRHYSIVDMMHFRGNGGHFGTREINSLFDPTTGSIAIPTPLDKINSPLADFFKADPKRTYQTGEYSELRGRDYFVASESSKKKTHDQKFELIQQELSDGIAVLQQIPRTHIEGPIEYLLYLGIIDYLKMHSQTLFHALTYEERYGITFDDLEKRAQYLNLKQKATDLMTRYTRIYYQTLFGVDFDSDLPNNNDLRDIAEIIDYTKKEEAIFPLKGGRNPSPRFKYPEVNHPLIIALGAQEAVLRYPSCEVLVGIPTGGTETTIVAQLEYELLKNTHPKAIFIPLSIHSEVKSPDPSFRDLDYYYDNLTYLIKQYYSDGVRGKTILVIDDNSASGQTLELMSRVLRDNLADVKVHVAEYDARRLLGGTSSQAFEVATFFNPQTSPSTMGLTQLGIDNTYQFKTEVRKRLK